MNVRGGAPFYYTPKLPKCKVEFNQPFCWLYSVPNLFVI